MYAVSYIFSGGENASKKSKTFFQRGVAKFSRGVAKFSRGVAKFFVCFFECCFGVNVGVMGRMSVSDVSGVVATW